jgi:hypothetical protein
MEWPPWWTWEIECTPHLEKRMEDRDFTEIHLRAMLEQASDYRPNHIEGRWMILTRHNGRQWAIIVEPDHDARLLVVVTAYPLET